VAPTLELTPLGDYIAGVLNGLRPLPPLGQDLTEASGHVLAEEVRARIALPAFDRAVIDGYAARWQDLLGAAQQRPVRLTVVGDVNAASWRPVRLAPGDCVSVAAGAPVPAAADVVVPPAWTDQGMAAVEVTQQPKRGHGVRRAGDEIQAGTVIASPGALVRPALVAVLASTGVRHVIVRPTPKVAVIATGDELVEAGQASHAGQTVDANSHALAAAVEEAGAQPYRIGICRDDPDGLRAVLADQLRRADLVVTTGGTGTGPGDMIRRILGSVRFTEVSLFPCTTLGHGTLAASPFAPDDRRADDRVQAGSVRAASMSPGPVSSRLAGRVGVGGAEVPVVCLPGDPGAALIGFEVLVRPIIRKLAGDEPLFRPSVRAHLLETVASPLGLREFRPAYVSERRGGGYTARPLAGGPYVLSGMAAANGLIVLGERVGNAAAGTTVDVLMLDRQR
jgi:molybdopterin molybdotransferase